MMLLQGGGDLDELLKPVKEFMTWAIEFLPKGSVGWILIVIIGVAVAVFAIPRLRRKA